MNFIHLGVGLGLLVLGLVFGFKLKRPGKGGVAEIENEAKVARDKAGAAASEKTAKELLALEAAAKNSRSRSASDVLVDMVKKGELDR